MGTANGKRVRRDSFRQQIVHNNTAEFILTTHYALRPHTRHSLRQHQFMEVKLSYEHSSESIIYTRSFMFLSTTSSYRSPFDVSICELVPAEQKQQ